MAGLMTGQSGISIHLGFPFQFHGSSQKSMISLSNAYAHLQGLCCRLYNPLDTNVSDLVLMSFIQITTTDEPAALPEGKGSSKSH